MREIVAQYLNKEISRRGFVNRLLGLGFTIANVEALLKPLDAAQQTVKNNAVGNGYSFKGTGGALAVEQTKAAGVEYIFTNPGSFEIGFFDALIDNPNLEIIMGLHEGVVVSMADGYAKVSGKPAFVNVHAIAGTAQMGGQLYNASRDGTPMVVTAGLIDNEAWNDDQVLAPHTGFDEKDVTRQFTKVSWEARQPAALPLMLRRAFKVATTEPGGPVFLAMARAALETKDVEAQVMPLDRFLLNERLHPSVSSVQKAAKILLEAKRPVMIVGDGIWKSGAQAEAVALAERLGMAVYDTQTSFGNFPRQHQNYLGMPGDGFNLFLMRSESAKRGVDAAVLVGSRDFGGELVPDAPEVPLDARIVRVGFDTGAMSRNYPTDAALIGDVKEGLADLLAAIDATVTKERLAAIVAPRIEDVRSISSARRSDMAKTVKENLGRNPVHPDELGEILARTIDKDAILVDENFTARYGAFPVGYGPNEQMRLATSGASLGWGIGASIGAKLAAPNRQVVCSIGDGAAMYSASGFWTQVRYGVPVLTVVSNNHNYQIVRWVQDNYKGRMASTNRYPGMYLGDPDIDFVKLAASQGVKGERVTLGTEIEAALKRGIAATREGNPYLVEVEIARFGPGADSTWYQKFNLAERRSRKV